MTEILRCSTFNTASPTLWVLEGLTMYLSPSENSILLQEMAQLSPPGSMFLMSVIPAQRIGVPRVKGSLQSTWKWGFPDTFVEVCHSRIHTNRKLSTLTNGVNQAKECRIQGNCDGTLWTLLTTFILLIFTDAHTNAGSLLQSLRKMKPGWLPRHAWRARLRPWCLDVHK